MSIGWFAGLLEEKRKAPMSIGWFVGLLEQKERHL